jgi:hypothetical protein
VASSTQVSGERRLAPAIDAQRRLSDRRANAPWVNGPQVAENYPFAYLWRLHERRSRRSPILTKSPAEHLDSRVRGGDTDALDWHSDPRLLAILEREDHQQSSA